MTGSEASFEQVLRRAVSALELLPGMRALDFGCGDGQATAALAQVTEGEVVALDRPSPALDDARARLRPFGPRVTIAGLDGADAARAMSNPFAGALLQGAFSVAGRALGLAARDVHAALEPLSRLAALTLVRVGRSAAAPEGLLLPREAAEVLDGAGFEPLTIELFAPAALASYCERLVHLAAASGDRALADGVRAVASPATRPSVALALLVGRRREPGEAPPLARGDA